jgi:putative glycosyltransferase (TIGR04372 family)
MELLVHHRDLPLVGADGATPSWLQPPSRGRTMLDGLGRAFERAAGSFWFECHRELRRQAGDDRLPADVRVRVRERAQGLLARAAASRRPPTPFPRRRLRERVSVTLPPPLMAQASAAAAAVGIVASQPLVAVEVQHRPDLFDSALAWLQSKGYQVARVGSATEPIGRAGVIELSRAPAHAELLELFVLLNAAFVVCESLGLQHLAYATNTPSLLLNAPDAFSGYPVRDDGLFTLRTAVELDTGETFGPADQLSERYVRARRNCGFRGNSELEILAAVREMHEGVSRGWVDAAGQARFRALVIEAAPSLTATAPFVAEWGPDAGFIGDGRLARCQADTLAAALPR